MKRLFFLCSVVVMLLVGCASPQQDLTISSTPSTATSPNAVIPEVDISRMGGYMEDLADSVYNHKVAVYEEDSGFSIHISLTGCMDESVFVDFIIDGTQILTEHLSEFNAPLHEFSVLFTISIPYEPSMNGNMLWVSRTLTNGMLTDTSRGRNIHKSNASLSDLSTTYDHYVLFPSGSSSKYLSGAELTVPSNIFSTPASENGLAGKVYLVKATIVEQKQEGGLNMVIADLGGQVIAVGDFVGYAASMDNLFLQSDPNADYSLPPQGSTVLMYLTYRGYSNTLQLPIFFLGANEYCVDTIRNR